jgi:ureidoglycolate lyase
VTAISLKPEPLTAERFAPYGDVISTSSSSVEPMNEARFDRYSNLATVDVDADGDVAISIVRSRTPTALPYHVDMVERHPLGSQAFVPLSSFSFIVVVAPPGESVDAGDLKAFVTNGSQGVNYHRGTWHMPLIAFGEAQEFLVVDRAPGGRNCEERIFDQRVILESPG